MQASRFAPRLGGAFTILMLGGLLWSGVAQAQSKKFGFTGSEQSYRVPGKVIKLSVVAIGGKGGHGAVGAAGSGGAGGLGARASATLPVSPGQLLYILVGERR